MTPVGEDRVYILLYKLITVTNMLKVTVIAERDSDIHVITSGTGCEVPADGHIYIYTC